MFATIGVGKNCASAFHVCGEGVGRGGGESVLTTMEEIFLKALKIRDDDDDSQDDGDDGW